MQLARSSLSANGAWQRRALLAPLAGAARRHGASAPRLAVPAAAARAQLAAAAGAGPRPRSRSVRVCAGWGDPVEFKPAKARGSFAPRRSRAAPAARADGPGTAGRAPSPPLARLAAARPPRAAAAPAPAMPSPQPRAGPHPEPGRAHQVLGSSKAATNLYSVTIDVGPEIAAGYTKGGQYVQVKASCR
jgi:hypothetical protein